MWTRVIARRGATKQSRSGCSRSNEIASLCSQRQQRYLASRKLMANDNPDLGAAARRLMRSRGHVALATSLAGHPYVSLVATACEIDASPLSLLSDLAQHTKNLLADPVLSLLFDGTAEY